MNTSSGLTVKEQRRCWVIVVSWFSIPDPASLVHLRFVISLIICTVVVVLEAKLYAGLRQQLPCFIPLLPGLCE